MKRTAIVLTLLLVVCFSLSYAGDPGKVDAESIERFEADFAANGTNKAAHNAIANNDMRKLVLNRDKLITHDTYFTHKLESAGITNQASSGRCWMYAGFNCFAPNAMKKLDLKEFRFSKAYLAFWDKVEKSNLFLEQIIAFRDREIDDRELQIVLGGPIGDGGWYNYFVGLVEKYGIVPSEAMPETKQSSSTGNMNRLINRKLRVCADELRVMHRDGKTVEELRVRKEAVLSEIYKMLVLCYGQPPKEFEYRYEPKDDSLKAEIKTYTPKSFAKEFIGEEMPEYVALVDDPNKPYDVPYKGKWSRNMYEIEDFTLLNVPVEKLKYYAKKSLLDSQLVWFACDIGKENCKDSAVCITGIYEFDKLLGVDFSITKAQRLAYGDGHASHAMALAGIDTTAAGETTKWLVENSWGTKRGDNGFWYMYDDWFSEYVYVVIVDKRLLEKDELDNFKKTPVPSEMWDVFSQSLRNIQ